MKLELKHLAPYLPYGLKVLRSRINGNERHTVRGMSAYNIFTQSDGTSLISIKKIKPILRPLSDLTNAITHDGNTFIPLLELANSNYYIESNLSNKFDLFQKNNDSYYIAYSSKESINKYQFNVGTFDEKGGDNNLYFRFYSHNNRERNHYSDITNYQNMFRWHFDVFGLIDKGLAVDINTINK